MITEDRKKEWRSQIEIILGEIEFCGFKVNDWENEFLDSIDLQLSGEKDLSFKQSSILRKIYDRIG